MTIKMTEGHITQQEHSILCVVADWKAPYEIAELLYPNGWSKQRLGKITSALQSLRDRYLVHYGASQNTYRITDRGRAAISIPTGERK